MANFIILIMELRRYRKGISEMGRKNWKDPKSIDIVVKQLVKKWKGAAEQKDFVYGQIWEKIVGQKVAAYTSVYQIRNKKLIVSAVNAAWMNELTFMKETIKLKAKSLFSEHNIEVEDVIFRLGTGGKKPPL